MKYLRQFGIIMCITLVGELLNFVLPLPVPASIYGLLLMLVLFMTGILKAEHVKETGMFLVEIMPIMFIPAGVGLLESWGVLKPMLLKVAIITVLSTVIVMVVSGRVTQYIAERKGGAKDETDVS